MFTLITADGTPDDLSPTNDWGDVPDSDRPLWSRYMVDYAPWFPGVTMMLSIAPGVLRGGTAAPRKWKDLARQLHAVGFTPTDYYLLCQDLELRLERHELTEAEHSRFFDRWGAGRFWQFVPNVDLWAQWPQHMRAGRSPRRATDYILSDGAPPPVGYALGPVGTTGAPVGD